MPQVFFKTAYEGEAIIIISTQVKSPKTMWLKNVEAIQGA
jgi:hypothetical protein